MIFLLVIVISYVAIPSGIKGIRHFIIVLKLIIISMHFTFLLEYLKKLFYEKM